LPTSREAPTHRFSDNRTPLRANKTAASLPPSSPTAASPQTAAGAVGSHRSSAATELGPCPRRPPSFSFPSTAPIAGTLAPPSTSYFPAPTWPDRLFRRQGPKPPHDLPHRLACLPPPTDRHAASKAVGRRRKGWGPRRDGMFFVA
jgi:hypothetical protein